jgi:hypothetical protein
VRSRRGLSRCALVRPASQEAESYASDNGIFFMETSAKTATNVNELFVAIGTRSRPPASHASHPLSFC